MSTEVATCVCPPHAALSVTIDRATSPEGRGFKWISSFFRRRKKKQKSRRDTCDCVPDPATLFGVSEFIKACFPIVRTGVPDCSIMDLRKSRITNPDTAINPAQKFFAYIFTKKYGACFIYEEKAERLTSTLQSTQLKSFLPAFLQKRRSVSPPHKQKDQP